MPFQVISPMLMNVDGSDFNEAVKNFVKLNRHLQISDLILTDQINNMRANIRYYNRGGRNKAGIRLYPTTERVITSFPGSPIGMIGAPGGLIGSPVVGISSNDPNAPFPLGPTFGQPSAVVRSDGSVVGIKPVVPVPVSGSFPKRVMAVPSSSIIGVDARGPVAVGPAFPIFPPTPVTFQSPSTVVEWVDNKGDKFKESDVIETAYANIKDKKVATTVMVNFKEVNDVKLEFTENKCKFVLKVSDAPAATSAPYELTRKGPTQPNYRVGVALMPNVVGPFPR